MPPTRSGQHTPTVVVFVRHGATPTTGKVLPGRAPGLHLSDKGRVQADQAAASLASALMGTSTDRAVGRSGRARSATTKQSRRIAAVYSSPMERARETAKPIAAALGLRVTTERGLIECDFGEWTGATLSALAKLPAWKGIHTDPGGFRFPGGESFPELQARVLGTVASFRDRHPGDIVVAVSHADPIKLALTDALGAHLVSMHRLWISTASISAVSYGTDGATVLAMNAFGDLSAIGQAL